MKKILFLSYLDRNYSRSGALYSALEKYSSDTIAHLQYQPANLRNFYRLINVLRHEDSLDTLVVVMSPSHLLAIIIRPFFKGPIILDAGWPLSDSSEIRAGKLSIRFLMDVLIDRIAMKLADLVLLESKNQKNILKKRKFSFRNEPEVIFTGLVEERFRNYRDQSKRSLLNFNKDDRRLTVVFRGNWNEEAGLERLDEIFSEKSDKFRLIICSSNLPRHYPRQKATLYVSGRMSDEQLAQVFQKSDLAIAQFGESKRIARSIPHKVYEYAYFGIPTICLEDSAAREVFNDNEFYFISYDFLGTFLNQLGENIEDSRKELAKRSLLVRKTYQERCSQKAIAKNFQFLVDRF